VRYRADVDADPSLVAELLALETDLLRPVTRRSRAALEALLAPDFAEIGRSGRVYDREAIIGALAAEGGGGTGPLDARVEDFAVRLLAPGIALTTYRTTGDPEGRFGARRSSLWCLGADGSWQMTFHQGTPVG
jgi:hypothetical protein